MVGDASPDAGSPPADSATEASASTRDARLVGHWRDTVTLPPATNATNFYFAADGTLEISFQRLQIQGGTCTGEIRRSGLSWETNNGTLVIRGYRAAVCAGENRCTNGAGQSVTQGCESAPNWSSTVDPSMASYVVSADGSTLDIGGDRPLQRVR